MYPLHQDIELSPEQLRIVAEYVREVGFHLPGATPDDFDIVPRAKYVGWNFMSEDLEAYAVGLRCTAPGRTSEHTFIRMSYGQLMGQAGAQRLPVNDPVLATDTLRMQRWWPTPTAPAATGVDSYATGDGSVPGVDMDLVQLEDTVTDIEQWAAAGHGPTDKGQFDFAVDFGVLLAGRYPRLKYFEQHGRLRDDQAARLQSFERRVQELSPVLDKLDLPTLQTIATPERRKHAAHND